MFPEIFIILVVLVLIAFILIKVHHHQIKLDIINKSKELLSKYGILYQDNKLDLIDIKDKTYQVLFFNVHPNQELTINSKTIWEIKSQGKPLLINQTSYLSSNYLKIVIIFPSTFKIKRYINENELEFVQFQNLVYNMHLVRYLELDELLKELSK
jgi:hypothetical protein